LSVDHIAQSLAGHGIVLDNALSLGVCADLAGNFLTIASGVVNSRTAGETLSDIGAAAAGHNHDSAYASIGHNHSGVYDPAGTAASAVSSHESSYSHSLLHAQQHTLVGADHTASGLTAGHFLKALSATTFGFAAHGLSYTDVGAAASGHNHSGVYDPVGTAAAAVSAHVSASEPQTG